MSGQMGPEYWREYRQRNRERLNAQQKTRRSTPEARAKRAEYRRRAEVRARENEARREVAPEPLPPPFTGHPLLERARQMAGSWYGLSLYDANREDAASEAVVAMLEGRDPGEAIRVYRASVRQWEALTMPLTEGV